MKLKRKKWNTKKNPISEKFLKIEEPQQLEKQVA